MASDLHDLAEIRARLYAMPPEEFTEARNQAAKQAGGALARAIRALRRPTLSAWLVNLLAARRADDLEELLRIGERLREAQRQLDGAELRELSHRRQAVITSLVAMARDLATAHGRQIRDGTIREAESTLRAAVADPEIADQVRGGSLTMSVEYSGLGIPSAESASPAPAAERTVKSGSRGKAGAGTKPTAKPRSPDETRSEEPGRARLRVIMGGRSAGTPRAPAHGDEGPSTLERARQDRIAEATAALAAAERELEESTSMEADATRRLGEIAAEFDELRLRERQLRTEQTQADRNRRRAHRRRQAAEKAVADARRRLR